MKWFHGTHEHETDPRRVRYGVARVYAQQCGYVLHDAEVAKNSMKDVFKASQINTLEPGVALKGRPDQLILPDDPNFLPDFNLMPVDLDLLDAEMATVNGSQRAPLSPYGLLHDLSSPRDPGGLVLPPSDSSFGGRAVGNSGSFGFRGDFGPDAGSGSPYKHANLLDDDLGLSLDFDGDIVMGANPASVSAGFMNAAGNTDLGGVESPTKRDRGLHDVRHAMSGGFQEDGFVPNLDDELPVNLPGDPSPFNSRDSHHPTVLSTTSETADAPIRRRARAPLKIISVDDTIELRNSDLARWSAEYAANMMGVNHHKHDLQVASIARRNAEYWVLGAGINTLDRRADHGARVFSSIQILEGLLNVQISSSNLKRPRAEDDVDADRRVRSRQGSLSRELGRDAFQDDYMPLNLDDTIEQGREAPTPLDDHRLSAAFPWNSGSQRPSNILSAGGLPTSTGGAPFMPVSRRGSRLISHSPLEKHGLSNQHLNMDDLQLPGSEVHIGLTSDDEFELYGPAANADTQTAAQSQWQRSILDFENANFLVFVQTSIDEADRRRALAPADDEENEQVFSSVDFETLLPPRSNSTIVAAQALLHVLALGTKNLLRIQQSEAYGPISLRAVAAAS
nr:hypothetical protein CFP56_24385 [Quercus suber]